MADLGTMSRGPSGALAMPEGRAVVVGRRERSVLPLLQGRKTVLAEARIEGRRRGREEKGL